MSNLIPRNKRNTLASNPFNLFDSFFNDSFYPFSSSFNSFRLDVADENDNYVIEAELPGVKKDDIFLELNDGKLIIGVEQTEESNDESKKYIHKERRYSSLRRTVNLGAVKSDAISAKLDDGILKVTVPKEELTPPNKQN